MIVQCCCSGEHEFYKLIHTSGTWLQLMAKSTIKYRSPTTNVFSLSFSKSSILTLPVFSALANYTNFQHTSKIKQTTSVSCPRSSSTIMCNQVRAVFTQCGHTRIKIHYCIVSIQTGMLCVDFLDRPIGDASWPGYCRVKCEQQG